MATFYKYKERDDISKSMIDWSGITKEISDNLMKEKNRRDDLKFEIEQDQNEKLKAIDEYAKGLDPTMNQAMLKAAQNYKDYLLSSHKLMKSGLVSVNDTKIKKQGAMDTFNALNDVTKVYNEKIGAFIETGGSLNEFIASNVAGALDIRKSQLIQDDMGRGSFVTMDENGNEVIVPVTSVNTILNDKYDRFDTTGQVVNTVKGIANWTLTSGGGYKSVSDFRQRGDEFYDKTLKSKVDAILNSDRKILEAASDMMGMNVTYDEKLYKENPDKYILAKNQGGKITFDVDKQKVKDRLYNEIDSAIGRTETQTPYVPTADERNRAAGARDEKQTFSLITRSLKGDKSALQSIISKPEYGIANIIDKGNGKFSIVKYNGDVVPMDVNSGISSAGGNFANAIGLSGEKYINFNTSSTPVNIKFSTNLTDVDYIEKYVEPNKVNTTANTSKLSNSLLFKKGELIVPKKKIEEIVPVYRAALQEIAGPLGVNASIDSQGNVTVDGQTIEEGYEDIPMVLTKIEEAANKSITPPPSDIRLKQDINLIGVSESGINIYSWKYKEGVYDDGIFTGVIAQEVPWATIQVGDYLHVDYSKVDVEFNKIA